MVLDQKDIQLLGLLRNHARLTNKDLALALGIAESSCHQRVKKLMSEEYFKSFTAELNYKKLGIGLEVMISVQLSKHERSIIEEFISSLRGLNGMIKFYHMTGNTDFLLHVAVRDSNELRSFILDKLADHNYIQNIETSMIYCDESVNNLKLSDTIVN